MGKHKTKQRLMAMVQSAIMVVGIMMPVSAIAQTQDVPTLPGAPDTTSYAIEEPVDKLGQDSGEPGVDKEEQGNGGKIIMAFTDLEESVAQQSAGLGTPLSELDLPDTLPATVDGEMIAVPVTWACEPEYKNEAGEYIFTAVPGEGYTLAEGVKTPSITAVFEETAPLLSGRMKLTGEETSETVVLSQEQAVADIAAAIQIALSNTDNAAVVVTGSKTDAGSTLSLNIPEGKMVIWEAVLKGGTADYLMSLTGKGNFEIAESGIIETSTGGAIRGVSTYESPYIPSITVSSGTVKAAEGCAIYIYSNIIESMAVTVSGGIVSNAGTEGNPAIYLMVGFPGYDKVKVTVKNGGKVKSTGAGGTAVKSSGNVLIQDAAEVSADGTAVMGKSITVEGGTVSANKTAIYAEKGILVSGGMIRAGDFAILSAGRGDTTTIQSGTVEATGADGNAVYAAGNVLVSGGTVSAAGDNGAAICSIASGSVVVEGGTVSASKTAISCDTGSVRVRGGTVTGGHNVIYSITGNSISVEGGKVEATDAGGNAIYTGRNVLVSGGTVSANADNGTAIMSMGTRSYVTVENGTVEATGTGGNAISAQNGAGILVSGGTIKAGNIAIHFGGRGRTVTVSGGTISARNTAINFYGDYDSTVAVSGGIISGGSIAINFEGFINPAITVSGGTIGGGGNAIRLTAWRNPTITITGGTVLGCGSKHTIGNNNAAIYMESGTPEISSPGAVIAWNKPAGNKLYGLNTIADLASLPESTAKWSRIDDKSGIYYGIDGFLEIDGISVAEMTADATGLDELKIGKDVDAVLTYTLTGSSYASGLDVLDFAPEGLPDWLNITDTVIESTTIRISLSGTPAGISEPLTLTLPAELPAANLTGGSTGISIPVSGTITIGAVARGDGAAIADLTIAEVTATYVTLEPITGLPNEQSAEYAISATDSLPPAAAWQESARFSGLSPNTEYYVFVRSKENENYAAGNPSSGIRFKTAKAQLSGPVNISGTPAYGATMTAVTADLCSTTPGVSPGQLGALSYQWWSRHPDSMIASMIPSATNSTYTLTEADIGKIICVEVMTENCEGTVGNTIEGPIDKAIPFGTPTYTKITHANQTLAGVVLIGNFINPHNNAPVPGVLSWDALPETLVKRGKAYNWTFMPEESANYHTAHGSIIPWPAATGGGGSNSYIPPAASTTTPGKAPNQPVTALTSVTATVGTGGMVNAKILGNTVTAAIAKAQEEAKKQGKTANGIGVFLDVKMPQGTSSLSLTLSQAALQSLTSANTQSLEIDGGIASLNLDLEALKEIQKQGTGSVTITIIPVQNLSAAAKKLIGKRPVYDVTISYVKDGKTVNITSLGKGSATLSFPYTPGNNEAVGYLFGVYVDGKGNATRIPGSAYDANSRSIIFSADHFSVYGVGYTTPTEKYTDIANHWAKESIDYAVGRGLFSGTADTKLSPDMAMDRGMLVTVLSRLAGADVSAYKTSSFSDVAMGKYYLPYVEWAYKKGIIDGIGNGKFAPERAVTREEIALILQNYAKATGYKLPITREAIAFADASSIGSIYKTTVTAMQQAGVMMGGSGNKFNPKTGATRAEVAAMLYRYIKLTIDPATAQGWTKNDSGQYLYYKDGKPLTGWQIIDGVRYYFYSAGVLQTGWVKDGDNWRLYSSNRALVGWWDIGSENAKKTYYFDTNGNMIFGKWLQIDGKWYYFNADGSLAKNTSIDGYEVDDNGVRKNK
jgi:hypothetical protein